MRFFWGPAVALALGIVGTTAAQDVRGAGARGAAEQKPAAAPAALPPGEKPAPTVISRLAEAGDAAQHEDADYLIAYQKTRNQVRTRGVTYSDGYTLYKVLTAAGACELGVLRFDYEPLSSRIEVRSVAVIRGDSTIAVPLDGLLDLPAPQSAIYWGPRMRVLQLPRLEVGDGVEVVTFRKGFTYALLDAEADAADPNGGPGRGAAESSPTASGGAVPPARDSESADDARFVPPMEGEYFDIVHFQASVPVVEMEYTLAVSKEKRLQSEVFGGPLFAATRYDADSTYFTWRGRDLAPIPEESRQPDETDLITKVVLTTVESWEAKSRWFFEVNRNQFEPDEAIRAKVAEIFEEQDLTRASEEAKAAALLHWVAQNIRYSGQTMGCGEGYTLHPGTLIFEQRSGVCKDIAGMLITMMRAAGMDSYGAMTMAGSRIEDVPADQFNHCVVALRKADGRHVMYDPTWVPFANEIWSSYEAEQHYLIGSAQGENLSRIPYSPPDGSPLRLTHQARLAADGTLEGTFRLEGEGAIDNRLRGFVSATRRREVRTACASLLALISPQVEIRACEHGDPLDFGRSMSMRIDYRIPQYALPVAGGLEFESPMMRLASRSGTLYRGGSAPWAEERETDVLLYFTQLFDGTEALTLPAGYVIDDPPKPNSVDETYGSFHGSCAVARGTLAVSARGEVRRRQIPPDGYAGFKKAMDAAKDWAKVSYRVEKGGAR